MLLGRNFADFLYPDDETEVLETFTAGGLQAKGNSPNSEIIFYKDGHNVWFYSNPTPIVQGDETVGFSYIHHITARKLMELTAQKRERLKDAMALGHTVTGNWNMICRNLTGPIVFQNL